VSKDDPPTLLIHGDKDDLVKLDNSERIETALKKEGVACKLIVMPGAGHGFGSEQGQQASEALIQWFDNHLGKSQAAAAP
jgi:dipeptidyl aminopeptidase/acylaminoacyl peptidase